MQKQYMQTEQTDRGRHGPNLTRGFLGKPAMRYKGNDQSTQHMDSHSANNPGTLLLYDDD
eukprot:1158281-Pelagomonas_calceolata.AAC.17